MNANENAIATIEKQLPVDSIKSFAFEWKYRAHCVSIALVSFRSHFSHIYQSMF